MQGAQMAIWIVLTVVVVAAALMGLWAYRRSPTPVGKPAAKIKVAKEAEYWGVQISAPAGDRACARVRELVGKAFPDKEKPSLPLPDCPIAHQCQCRYIKLLDRRKDDRRSGKDKRVAGVRFEKGKTPRRSGKDRRKKIDWY
jgi:hypothetical protein